jgi:hypothetical protein
MRNRRRKTRLADKATFAIASLFLAVTLMVRDPQPAVTTPPQGDVALIITLIFMALGMCVVSYGLYHERHKLREYARVRLVYTRYRLTLRMRLVRRAVSVPGLRRAIRDQRAWSQA